MENDTNKPISAGLDAATEHVKEPEAVYSTRDALDFINDDRPEPEEVWGGLQFVPGQIMEVIGASGLGKSRILLNLAINQVLGLPFADMPVMPRPLKWLFYGNENSFFRFRKDLRKMTYLLNSEALEQLRGHIFLPTMETAADSLVSFSDPRNVAKLEATIRQREADVVVMDPWGAIIDGDELADGDVRKTIALIQHILMAREGKTVVGIILNHSRNGIKEEIDAAGANKANFGKNSKAIYSIVRCVWNLRRAELNENPKKIELIHAKASDSEHYPPVAVELNPEYLTYSVDTTFNHAVWQATLEKAYRQGNAALTTEERSEAKSDEEEQKRDQILRYIETDGPMPKSTLDGWTKKLGWPEKPTQRLIKNMIDAKSLAEVIERVTSKKKIGTPDQIMKLLNDCKPGEYR